MIDDDVAAEQEARSDARNAGERRTLQKVLGINLGQCAAGVAVGAWAMSTALIGVALDNLADAAVYAVSLYAIGRSPQAKVRAARLSGWLLIGLAILLLLEVLRRFFGGEPPIGAAMMIMAGVNAVLNIICLRLLRRHGTEEVHFKASAIFTSNDSIVNLGTVVSGALVMWLGSNVPDLVLGVAVALIAARGGKEILEAAADEEPV
jgi:Co/Zn/Cd efflux system component